MCGSTSYILQSQTFSNFDYSFLYSTIQLYLYFTGYQGHLFWLTVNRSSEITRTIELPNKAVAPFLQLKTKGGVVPSCPVAQPEHSIHYRLETHIGHMLKCTNLWWNSFRDLCHYMYTLLSLLVLHTTYGHCP